VRMGLVAALVAAACGASHPSAAQEAKHRTEIGKLHGTGPVPAGPAWDDYVKTVRDECAMSRARFNLFAATAIDGGDNLDQLRVSMRYECPKKASWVDDAKDEMARLNAKTGKICAKAPGDRTPDERNWADAFGCPSPGS
jgi:hypothetical protein